MSSFVSRAQSIATAFSGLQYGKASQDKGDWSDSVVDNMCSSFPLYLEESLFERFVNATDLYNWYFGGYGGQEKIIMHSILRSLAGASAPSENFVPNNVWKFKSKDVKWYTVRGTRRGLVSMASGVAELSPTEMEVLYSMPSHGTNDMQEKYKELQQQNTTAFNSLRELHTFLLKFFTKKDNIDAKSLFNKRMTVSEALYRYTQPAAYISACTFRLLGKDIKTAPTIFSKKSFQENISKFGGWVGSNFPRPGPEFVKQIGKEMTTNNEIALQGFAHLLTLLKHGSSHASKFANAACLMHLKYNGMSLIKHAEECERNAHAPLKSMVESLYTNTTEASWKALSDTLIKYNMSNPPSVYWYWAKIVDNDYFTSLKSSNHAQLCAIFHGVLQAAKPTEYESVNKAYWVNNTDPVVYTNHVTLGRNYFNKRIHKLKVLPGNEDLLSDTEKTRGTLDDRQATQAQLDEIFGKETGIKTNLLTNPVEPEQKADTNIMVPAMTSLLINFEDKERTEVGNTSFDDGSRLNPPPIMLQHINRSSSPLGSSEHIDLDRDFQRKDTSVLSQIGHLSLNAVNASVLSTKSTSKGFDVNPFFS